MYAPSVDGTVALTIDGITVTTAAGTTILAAADAADIYIPRLCAHPDLPPMEPEILATWPVVWQGGQELRAETANENNGRRLKSIFGNIAPLRACATVVTEGMRVNSTGAALSELRQAQMRQIFVHHPHACVQCAQRAGCSREPCSTNVDKEERCCDIFHDCELRRVAEHVGIPDNTSRYRPAGLPVLANDPLLRWDHELCIGCLRCVRICRDVRGADALGFLTDAEGRVQVGMRAATLADSGCHYCLGCVEICPTGALLPAFEEFKRDGERVPACVAACPAGIDIPRYLREIRRGEFARAAAVVREAAPLPRVLSQVCFHPCEDACLRTELGSEALAACALKRAAVVHADESPADGDWRDHLAIQEETGKKIAIVGAGPAGLSAAWFLRLQGHEVVVLDAQPAVGGWMRDGIPAYRLEQAALEQDVADIGAIGVQMRPGIAVGKDVPVAELRHQHDAVLLAVGARRAKTLTCPGADLPGVMSGLALLQELATARSTQEAPPNLDGEEVTVIGGGNVAMDVARTALRLGAAAVHLYCLEERDEMPAHGWEIAAAEAEGVVVHPGWGPIVIVGTEQVEGVDFARCVAVFDDQGRFAPQLDEATNCRQDSTRVLVTIGQEPQLEGLAVADGLRADPTTCQTGIDGVFACGEVISGPASVVTAVAQGRQAAAGIDRYLGGDGCVTRPLLTVTAADTEVARREGFCRQDRVPVPQLAAAAAAGSFDLVDGCYSADAARQEADRCLRCDLRLTLRQNAAPPAPWLAWSADTVATLPAAAGVYQLLDEDKLVYAIKGVADLREHLSELLQSADRACYLLYEEEPLYSKRESELIQVFLQQHGKMPPGEGDDDLDDLF